MKRRARQEFGSGIPLPYDLQNPPFARFCRPAQGWSGDLWLSLAVSSWYC
jgi:hypothetical protein